MLLGRLHTIFLVSVWYQYLEMAWRRLWDVASSTVFSKASSRGLVRLQDVTSGLRSLQYIVKMSVSAGQISSDICCLWKSIHLELIVKSVSLTLLKMTIVLSPCKIFWKTSMKAIIISNFIGFLLFNILTRFGRIAFKAGLVGYFFE